MKNGKCLKCLSENVVVTQSEHGGVGHHFTLFVMADGDSMSATMLWQTYLCLDCGYFENYLTDRRLLETIKANLAKSNWKKV